MRLCSQSKGVWFAAKLDWGLRGFWRVLAGHIGHVRLANRMIYWLRRPSPICLAQSSAIIPRPDEISRLTANPAALGAIFFFMLAAPCVAREAPSSVDDPVLENRVIGLTSELRCLVCQNQSLADSHADLAIDLKDEVRSQMRAGKTDAEIRDYMVARYGDFVLYDPPFKRSTLLLWAGPFALLLLGLLGLAAYVRNRRRRLQQGELPAIDQARAEALLRGQSGSEPR